MPTVAFEGRSDDLVEVWTGEDQEEYPSYGFGGSASSLVAARFSFKSPGSLETLVRVYAIYDGCWSFAVSQPSQSGEVSLLLEWPVRVFQSPNCNYSLRLEIDVPDGVTLEQDGVCD